MRSSSSVMGPAPPSCSARIAMCAAGIRTSRYTNDRAVERHCLVSGTVSSISRTSSPISKIARVSAVTRCDTESSRSR
ncbi:Uncharacterised protein [Mycobacteroides abscessus subsp. abscessus]|nr:Uncharacterised protein [Mycobacteroides abscessus subsp. abscessus]